MKTEVAEGQSRPRRPIPDPDTARHVFRGQGGSEPVTEKNVVPTIHDTLHDEMQRDERIVVLGEDVGARGGVFRATMGFLDEFGEERVLDTPLDECLIAGVAIGMALDGLLPVAEMQFADFIFPAFNQIVSGGRPDPLPARTATSAYRWSSARPTAAALHGALYHSQSIEAFFAHVPGLKVVAPSTPHDAKGMLIQAIEDPDPVIFLEHKKTLPPDQGRGARRALQHRSARPR